MKLIIIILVILAILYFGNAPYLKLEFTRIKSLIVPHKNQYKPKKPMPLKILFITAEDRSEEYIKLHDKSIKNYADFHGYEYLRMDNCNNVSTYWCKINKLKELLTFDYDYVIWLDSDVCVVDSSIDINIFLAKYGYPDIVFGKQNMPMDIGRYNINAGIIIIKRSIIGKSFIDDCLSKINEHGNCFVDNKEQGPFAGACYEEGIINILAKSDQYKNNVIIDMDNEIMMHYIFPVSIPQKRLIFLHLAGQNNQFRAKTFNKILNNIK